MFKVVSSELWLDLVPQAWVKWTNNGFFCANFQILVVSLAVYAICIPLDKSSSNDQTNDGASVDIQPAVSGHAVAANGNADKIAADANANANAKHLTKRETPDKDDSKAPTTTTVAPADPKDRKTRETAGKSERVKENHHRNEALHKSADHAARPKRESEYSNSQQGQRGQQGQYGNTGSSNQSSQQGQQGQYGQMGQSSQMGSGTGQTSNFEHRRASRSAGDERAAKDASAEKDAKPKHATSNTQKQ